MKKFIITLLGVLFLSATMNAAAVSEAEAEAIKNSATYCVELPGHDVGNSGWTKRDNHVGARWKFSVSKQAAFGRSFRGNWEGETVPDHYLYNIDHIWYSRGDRPLCVNYERLKRDLGRPFADAEVWLWLDVKYGNDCTKVNLSQNFRINYRMKIVKSPGDLVNPWYCWHLQ